jgi:IS5 family transposase
MAYDSQALRDKLGELGIEDRIAYKAKRNKPLVNWQVWFNKTASRIRRARERDDEELVWDGVRYLGLDRNNCHLQFVAMAMNMKRARLLIAAP